ncbi:MAG: cation:proton antiporter [Lewinellaceae bacterium]|jgi:NhaP-type Na+/H+ or K+/H+ antiporter|nr:cation:proton antiporter [Lewinellaceae bacterium]
MENLSAYTVLFSFCGLIILSYLFSVLNRVTRIPSVLLLLGTGIGLRYLSDTFNVPFDMPAAAVEFLGTIGLIMIVLEAGLDLEVTKKKLPLIRSSFFSALIILIISTFSVAGILQWWMPESPFANCVVYAIVLSIVSSAIVLPSVGHLSHEKREFLIYEASFSDVLGIMAFNFLTAGHVITTESVTWFIGSIPVAIVLSVVVCFALMMLLIKNRINIKFFLMFAVLIVIYIGGKMMHLPSLIAILMFGLVVNNWELVRWKPLKSYFSDESVNDVVALLKSITAESSFLIRTFFFIIFGYSIKLSFLQDPNVLLLGSLIVVALMILRYIYLRILHKYTLFPELLYIPRGLITILLFYKIPSWQRIDSFDEGVLFFVILATGIIMMLGSLFYHDEPVEIDKTTAPGPEVVLKPEND